MQVFTERNRHIAINYTVHTALSISPNDVASKIVVVVIAMVIKQTVLNFFLEKVYIQTEPV